MASLYKKLPAGNTKRDFISAMLFAKPDYLVEVMLVTVIYPHSMLAVAPHTMQPWNFTSSTYPA